MLSSLLFTLRSLFRRKSAESELHSELQFHFDHQVQKFQAAGLSLQEANRRAKLIIGTSDHIKEQCREARGTHLLESTAQDIRYALRILRKSPGFTAVAILTFALGIGVNTSIFSLIYSLAVRTLPVKDPASIVNIYENFRGHFSRGVDSSSIQSAIQQITRTLDPSVRVSTETLEQALAAILAPSKTIALMVAVLGILAMLLAVVGVSGMVAYAATQRTREIGIRMALGAQPTNIAQLLLTQAIRQSIIGLAVGIAIAAVASQLLNASSLLFGLNSLDPLTYSATSLSLAAVTLAASYLPVRRATHSDPLSALRHH